MSRGEHELSGFSPERATPLAPAEVHVWEASLDLEPRVVDELARLLSDDERDRARRFRFDVHRSRYVVARGLLRLLLARHAGVAPGALRFHYGGYGKPTLAGPGPAFNVSHSGPVALYALRARGEVGVDVEVAEHARTDLAVATRFFSPGEVKTLFALAPDLRPAAFLTCWTRKEAFIKARGDGLSLALDSFDVTLAPGQAAALTRTAWAPAEIRRWGLADVSDPQGRYIAAVACDGQGWSVVRHRAITVVGNEIQEAS
jgi:4'-phosphopantetheinyl transferase